MTASIPTRRYDEEVDHILAGQCMSSTKNWVAVDTIQYWNTESESGAPQICRKVDDLVADPGSLEDGESLPSQAAIDEIKDLLTRAEKEGVQIPSAEASLFFGEVAVSWQIGNRYVRLVSYSDGRTPLLYFDESDANGPSRGVAIRPATVEALRAKLVWLLGDGFYSTAT